MKRLIKVLSVSLLLAFVSNTMSAQGAIVEIEGSTGGFLVPRMTSNEWVSILNPAEGLLVYDTDQHHFYYFNGSGWQLVSAGVQGPVGPAGESGNTILAGTGSPTGGVDGDFYIDTATSDLYGPKSGGTWPSSGVSLIGPEGPQGIQGAQGIQGQQGPIGATGPQGPIGATGASGTNGTDGDDGADGKTILNGTGSPSGGVNGDFYLNTTTSELFGPKSGGAWPNSGVSLIGPEGPQGAQGLQGVAGSTGATGPQGNAGPQGPIGATGLQGPIGPSGAAGTNGTDGDDGADGKTILSGMGAPSGGVNGDFYIDIATSELFGPKSGGAWPNSGVSLIGPEGPQGSQGLQGVAGSTGATGPQGNAGPQGPIGATGLQGPIGPSGAAGTDGDDGADGKTILSGMGAPSGGVNGDFYLNTTTSELFGPKSGGTWPNSGISLIGPEGPQGAQGPQGVAGSTGATGPQGPTGSTGAAGTNGTNGTDGDDGADGRTILNGTGSPSGGVNGDFYLNTTTSELFGPKSGGAWPNSGVSLIGPQGIQGPQGIAGATGMQGAQGPAGAIGATGPAGPAASDDQDLSLGSVTAVNRTINISGGSGVTFSVADNDNSSTNEIELPSSTGQQGKVLTVNSSGNPAWQAVATGSTCNIVGDGSAGNLTISSNTNWINNPPTNGNYRFNNLTINSNRTLTVPSGVVIMVSGTFTNNGTINVDQPIPGFRWSGNPDGGFPAVQGLTLSHRQAYENESLRSTLLPGPVGGSNGGPGGNTGLPIESGKGGGTIVIRATTFVNNGDINANGGNAVDLSGLDTQAGTGGGGGGMIVIIYGNTPASIGALNARGGDGGTPGGADDDHAGGGGGGGLVHLIGANASLIGGTISIIGGTNASVASDSNDSANFRSRGGNGGAGCGGDGGTGGEHSSPTNSPATDGATGAILRTQIADVCVIQD